MNPVLNPATVGFALAAGVGLVLGAAFGLIQTPRIWRVWLHAAVGLAVVYLVGWFVCWPILLVLPVWAEEPSGATYGQFWQDVLMAGPPLTLIGMLTGAPAFLLGFYKGRLKRAMLITGGRRIG